MFYTPQNTFFIYSFGISRWDQRIQATFVTPQMNKKHIAWSVLCQQTPSPECPVLPLKGWKLICTKPMNLVNTNLIKWHKLHLLHVLYNVLCGIHKYIITIITRIEVTKKVQKQESVHVNKGLVHPNNQYVLTSDTWPLLLNNLFF